MNLYNFHSKPKLLVGYEDRYLNYALLDSELKRIEDNLEHSAGNISNDDFDDLIDRLVLDLPEEAVNGISQFPELVRRLDNIEGGQI